MKFIVDYLCLWQKALDRIPVYGCHIDGNGFNIRAPVGRNSRGNSSQSGVRRAAFGYFQHLARLRVADYCQELMAVPVALLVDRQQRGCRRTAPLVLPAGFSARDCPLHDPVHLVEGYPKQSSRLRLILRCLEHLYCKSLEEQAVMAVWLRPRNCNS